MREQQSERDAFHAWLSSKHPGIELAIRCDGEYWSAVPDAFWEAWQARAALTNTPAGLDVVETKPATIESGEPSESAGMPVPDVIHYPPPQSVWLFPVPKDDATTGVFE